jgi:hypothetical protein
MTGEALDLAREQYRTIKYLGGFVREWDRLGLSDEDLSELEHLILSNPDAGDVVSGTGGLRKLRFSPSSWRRGKRGALRIGYSHRREFEVVLVIAVYPKNEKSNFTATERREIKRLLDLFWRREADAKTQ